MRKWDGKTYLNPRGTDPQEYKALVDTGAQCTRMPSSYIGAEPICISGVTGGSQQLTVLEAEVNLTGNEWQKPPIVTGPEAPCILGIDYLRRGYFKDPRGYWWAFFIAALETEEIKQLSTLPGLSEDPSIVGLLRAEEQQVPIATTTVHRRQYRTNQDSLIPIHKLIRVISTTRSPFNSPIWPVRKSNGEWRLTVDYRGLNEVMPSLSAAVPDMQELQYELESKAAKWYATTDIANAFFSIPLAAECRPQFAFTWRGVQYTWNRLPQGWKHSPTICHGLIQMAQKQEEEVTRAEEAPLYNQLPENEKQYALFTDGSCRIVGKHRRWKAAVWSPIRQVVETAEGDGELSQFAETLLNEKSGQCSISILIHGWWQMPCGDGYSNGSRTNWQRGGKPIWAAALWQDIAAQVENLVVKVHHVDAHVPKSQATEEHQNNQQVDQAAKMEVAQVDLDWQFKGELFIAQWGHDTSGHQGRDAT
ncbi:hypothetical protein QYF61_004533 [Mycteria americana]|uniref:RNase H type-1 domain-containing protein n=1 Tax=Mycteria americana TaxID=33587 RepID=A0AAN7MNS4_MYCAM|nr:hypothetical protein QYF61_004533 [Mycteria americana]